MAPRDITSIPGVTYSRTRDDNVKLYNVDFSNLYVVNAQKEYVLDQIFFQGYTSEEVLRKGIMLVLEEVANLHRKDELPVNQKTSKYWVKLLVLAAARAYQENFEMVVPGFEVVAYFKSRKRNLFVVNQIGHTKWVVSDDSYWTAESTENETTPNELFLEYINWDYQQATRNMPIEKNDEDYIRVLIEWFITQSNPIRLIESLRKTAHLREGPDEITKRIISGVENFYTNNPNHSTVVTDPHMVERLEFEYLARL